MADRVVETGGFDPEVHALCEAPSVVTAEEIAVRLTLAAGEAVAISTVAKAIAALCAERTSAAVEAARADGACDVCAGTGNPVSGLSCICSGTGRALDAVSYLRDALTRDRDDWRKAEAESIREAAVADERARVLDLLAHSRESAIGPPSRLRAQEALIVDLDRRIRAAGRAERDRLREEVGRLRAREAAVDRLVGWLGKYRETHHESWWQQVCAALDALKADHG